MKNVSTSDRARLLQVIHMQKVELDAVDFDKKVMFMLGTFFGSFITNILWMFIT